MGKKKRLPNPHCPVKGCDATAPHDADQIGKALLIEFGNPERLTLWAQTAMAELAKSIQRDVEAKNVFA